ncbi:unnamed protein product [Ambrosiozyma monospora]|uniref:Unnamed protein product n=1 Tax=Ambrosiozyma monospora TaxID=43982 RepID=A0ACB5T1T6_AMBMO|nr:unnamed protein product [Ambrosiozyma monospora]
MFSRILNNSVSKTRLISNSRPITSKNLSSTFNLRTPLPVRLLSSGINGMDDYESKIYQILEERLEPKSLSVRDISGGCGSMFAISVESGKFKGLTMVKQHRLVNEILKDEIAKWHGLQLKTKVVK